MNRAERRTTRERDAWLAGGAAALVVTILAVALGVRGCGSDDTTPKQLEVTWTVTPQWDHDPPPLPSSGAREGDLEIYLDISQPFGGFLPPASHRREPSGFRSVVRLVQNHLDSVAGSASSRLRWFTFAAEVVALPGAPRLERRLFDGRQTRLDLALERMTRGVSTGKVRAAALITDLNASEDEIGAMGAARPLRAWMESPRVRSGELHAGLLGVRAAYWGVSGTGCSARGELGCWYSEHLKAYLALHRRAQAPFYVLLLGGDRQTVEGVAGQIRRETAGLGLQTEWELLSAASLPKKVAANCSLRDGERIAEDQYALIRHADGAWECVQEDRVELRCPMPAEGNVANPELTVSWRSAAFGPRLIGEAPQSIAVGLDCRLLRERQPADPLTLQVTGVPPQRQANGRWADWTSITDEREEDLRRTPQLASLVDSVRLRPGRLAVVSSPLLRMSGRDGRR
jgi:hypothetical protein